MEISEKIYKLRNEHEMTQVEFGKIAGASGKAVSTWENGKKEPRMKSVARICAYFGIDINQFTDSSNDIYKSEDAAEIIPPGFDPLPHTVRIPLVGSIACGEPITAEENIEYYIDAPDENHPDFALKCKGESMIEAGIEDGDIVYIQKTSEVRNGEIAAVRIGDEATLKYLYWDNEVLTLVPANKAMFPRTYTGEALDDIHIEGKAVGFTHWFK